jgi:hypothetical protein
LQDQVNPAYTGQGLPTAHHKLAFTKRLYDFALGSIDILVEEISHYGLDGSGSTLLSSEQHAR